MQVKPYIFLFLVLLHSTSAQITFTSPTAQGVSCSYSINTVGLTISCSGKGFYVMDPLVMGYTTVMDITVTYLALGQAVGIGLGQKSDANCLSSNYPPSGQTWATCTPSSTTCKTSACMFNKVTAFSSSAYSAAYSFNVMQVNKRYVWEFTPPSCPSTSKCWRIQVSSKFLIAISGS